MLSRWREVALARSEHGTGGDQSEQAEAGAPATDSDGVVMTPGPVQPGGGRWRLRHWRLLAKFIALLVIPLVLAVALGAARVSTSVTEAGELRALQRQVELSQQVAAVAHELQHERHLVAAFIATDRASQRAPADAQVHVVDDAIATLLATDADPDELSSASAQSYRDVLSQLSGLDALRAESLAPNAVGDIAIGRYGERIGVLLRFSRLALAGTDASLVGTADAVDALADAKEQVSTQHAVLLSAGLVGDLLPFQLDLLRQSSTRFTVAITDFTEAAPSSAEQQYRATVNGTGVTDRDELLNATLNLSRAGAPELVDPGQWDAASTETADLVRDVEAGLLGQLAAQSAALSDQARNDAIRDGVIIALAVLLALLLLLLVARSVLNPLRTLRLAAFDIAERQLPAVVERMRTSGDRGADVAVMPVPVDTREDIGEVARAFDAVHTEAVRLASEQAELRANVNDIFVNLSRRSQGLVERQLQLIDQLEDGERDPEQLAALFRLDHLATRMRRNSENLLVLAGADLRQRGGQAVPVLDILRAAASEIEQYRRIVVKPPPSATVSGPVVNDLVHLIAELLDNATAYAPPDSTVSVASAVDADGTLRVEIADVGVGLEPDALAAINHRLAEPPRVDVSVSRQMGLFVVGRLAGRHDINVRLATSETIAGVIAHVQVPAALTSTGVTGGSAMTGVAGASPESALQADPLRTGPGAADETETELFGAAIDEPDDPLFGSRTPSDSRDASTPIFEEITSAWFRDLRRVPVPMPVSARDKRGAHAADWGSAAEEGRLAANALRQPNGHADVTAAGLPKRRPRALLVPGAARATPVTSSESTAGPEGPVRNADAVRGRLSSFQRGVREGRKARHRSGGTDADPNDGDEQ